MSCVPIPSSDDLVVATNDPTFVPPALVGGVTRLAGDSEWQSVEGDGTLVGITEFADVSEFPRKYKLSFMPEVAVTRSAPGSGARAPLREALTGVVTYNESGTRTSRGRISSTNGGVGDDWTRQNGSNVVPSGTPWEVGNDFGAGTQGGVDLDTYDGFLDGVSGWDAYRATFSKTKRSKRFLVSDLLLAPDEGSDSPKLIWHSGVIGDTTNPQARTEIRAVPVYQGDGLYRIFGYWTMTQPNVGSGPLSSLSVLVAPGDVDIPDGTTGQVIGQLQVGPGSSTITRWFSFDLPAGVSFRLRMDITFGPGYVGYLPARYGTSGEMEEAGLAAHYYLPADPDDLVIEYGEYLGREDTIEDALNRGTPVAGSSAIAETTDLSGGVSAESTDPITFSARTVKLLQTFNCLTPGLRYQATISGVRQDIDTGAETPWSQTHIFDAVTETQQVTIQIEQPPMGFRHIPQQLGAQIIGATPPSPFAYRDFDNSEVMLYATNVKVAGGDIDDETFDVLDAFYTDYKVSSFASDIRYLLPMLGGAAACGVPLIDRSLFGNATVDGFVSGDFSAQGLKGDGVAKQITLPFKASQLGSSGYGGYAGGVGAIIQEVSHSPGTANVCGAFSSGGTDFYGLSVGGRTVAFTWNSVSVSARRASAGYDDTRGHFYGNRRLNTQRELYVNGALVGTGNTDGDNTNGAADEFMRVFGHNTLANPSRISVFYATNGEVDATDAADIHTLLNTHLFANLGRSASTVHPQVATWRDRVTAFSGTFTDEQLSFINDFVNVLSAKDYFRDITVLYPFWGDDLTAALFPVLDFDARGQATNVGFLSGDYDPEIGLTGDGTKRLTLPVQPNQLNVAANNNGGYGFWLTAWSGASLDFGYSANPGSVDTRFCVSLRAGASNSFFTWGAQVTGAVLVPSVAGTGFWIGQRASATSRKFFKDGAQIGSENTTNDPATGSDLAQLRACALFRQHIGDYQGYLNGACGLVVLTNGGLSDAEVQDLYETLRDEFMTPTGRI